VVTHQLIASATELDHRVGAARAVEIADTTAPVDEIDQSLT
jgi:hypothetical protein